MGQPKGLPHGLPPRRLLYATAFPWLASASEHAA